MDHSLLVAQLDALFHTTLTGIAAVDAGRYVRVNDEFARITGRTKTQLEGRLAESLDPSAGDDGAVPGRSEYECDFIRPDGVSRRLVVDRVCLGEGRYLYSIIDITEQQERANQVAVASSAAGPAPTPPPAAALPQHDALTGLPNRGLLHDRMRQALARAHRWSEIAAVLLVDLDRFDAINSTHGQETGDRVLCLVAERLKTSLRSSDTVARLDGDVFVVVAECGTQPADVRIVAAKILDAVRQPMPRGRWPTPAASGVDCSIGISQFPRDGNDVDSLINLAGAAMRRAKEAGGGRAVDYRQT